MTHDARSHDPYARFAQFYDLEYASFDADLDFYRSFAVQANGPILELGCGTGRVLAGLEGLGLPLTGVDSSRTMLDIATAVLDRATTLIECDIVDLESCTTLPDNPYWMAFSAINSFLHLGDINAQIDALRAVRSVMIAGGILLLDLMVPEPSYLSSLDGRLHLELSATLPDGRRLDKLASRTHDLATQTIHTTVFFDTIEPETGAIVRVADTYDTRYIHRFELEHLLERSGWRLISVYGSYDLETYTGDSERMIALATWGDMNADCSEGSERV